MPPLPASVPPAMRLHITARLHEVAEAEGVRILLAVESGSRAWGFASPDSDWDVRFVYAHGKEWYTQLNEGRDVIERPLDEHLIDLGGWDVRKALRLLLRSNPPLAEWLQSPIVYGSDGLFRDAAWGLYRAHASPKALAHHYHSIALGTWRGDMQGRPTVRLKRYFYVLRALLALHWVIDRAGVPPMTLAPLLAGAEIPATVSDNLNDLWAQKTATPELGEGAPIAALDDWITDQLRRLEPSALALTATPSEPDTVARADALFRRTVGL